MAIVQENKAKVTPIMDYLELNQNVDAFTADVDFCVSKQSGPSMDLMYPCWIWEGSICKSGSVNHCGRFKQ